MRAHSRNTSSAQLARVRITLACSFDPREGGACHHAHSQCSFNFTFPSVRTDRNDTLHGAAPGSEEPDNRPQSGHVSGSHRTRLCNQRRHAEVPPAKHPFPKAAQKAESVVSPFSTRQPESTVCQCEAVSRGVSPLSVPKRCSLFFPGLLFFCFKPWLIWRLAGGPP